MKDYVILATGSLRKRFLRTLLTMIGIFIGIAAVVALVSLGQGMQAAINDQFATVGTDKVILEGASAGFGPPGQLAAGRIDEDDLDLVQGVPGVSRAAGRLMEPVSVQYEDKKDVTFCASLPEDSEERDLVMEAFSVDVEKGRHLKSSDRGKVVVGYQYWGTERYRKPVRIGKRIDIQGKDFEVVGLLKKSGRSDNVVLVNEDDLRDLVGKRDELSAVVAQAGPGVGVDELADRIRRTVRKDRGQKEGFEDFTVETSQELIASVNTILGVLQGVFIGIALISLLVGGIGIMNTMYTAVLERTREIGIMKAVGAKNRDVLTIFLIESGLLGLFGGIIGILLGMGLSKLVEIGAQDVLGDLLRAHFPWYLIIGSLLFSLLIGTMSGILPAIQASRMQPVEALRND